jgi:PAS domain S-box-containing protein
MNIRMNRQTSSHWLKRRLEAVVGMVVSLPVISVTIIDYYAIPKASRQATARQQRHPSPSAVGFGCLCLMLLTAIVERWVHEEINFILFYLLIAAYAAWYGGRKVGVAVALLSSLAIFVNEAGHHPRSGLLYWNLLVQIAILLFVVLLVSAFCALTKLLEQRVMERTAALEREIDERKQTEEQLRKAMQQLRQLAENINDAFWIRNAEETRLVYASPAYERIWGRNCKELYQSADGWSNTIHPEDQARVAEAVRTQLANGEYNQQYRIIKPDGSLRWIRDRAFPIRDGTNKIIRFVGIAEDITDHHLLEREILEISDREQARIGQDLHDGLCQQLVSLAFDSNSLEQQLAARGLPEATTARKMAQLLDDSITEARAVARGLFPVQLEADGLSLALQQLAAGVSARTKVHCRVDCPQPVLVRDNAVATHLYRIAQEAVNNALKHGQAGSILIQLISHHTGIKLGIEDDGVGITVKPTTAGGMGLHIMNYRAQAVGGELTIERAGHRGTVVTCFAPQISA